MGVETKVCSVADIDSGGKQCFVVKDHRVCIVHLDADWYAIDDTCSHEDYSLCEGDVWADEREIECPKHGSTFSLLTGDPQTLPATRPVPVYEVRIEGDDVIVNVP